MHWHPLRKVMRRDMAHPNVITTYDYGWVEPTANPQLRVRPEATAMVILMEFCNLKSLSANIASTNRFGHHSVRSSRAARVCLQLYCMLHLQAVNVLASACMQFAAQQCTCTCVVL